MKRPRSPRLLRPDRSWFGSWVDERLLLQPGISGEVLSVGGVERAVALAIAGCRVTSVHPDTEGLALLGLVRAGGGLAWEEHLQVLGLLAGGRRVLLYHQLRASLDADSRAFWDAREARVREGVLRVPALERFRALTAPLPGWAQVEALLAEPDSAKRAQMVLPSSDRAFSMAGRLAFGRAFPERLDRALLGWGPDAFAVEWLTRGTLRAPQRPALSRAGHAALGGARIRGVVSEVGAFLSQCGERFDAVDLGYVAGDPSALVAAARRVLRPGGQLSWWGQPLAGARTQREPCPWAPDLQRLMG